MPAPAPGPILATVDVEVEHYQLVRAAEQDQGQSSNKGAERPGAQRPRRSNTGMSTSSRSDKPGILSKLLKPIKAEKGAAKVRDDDKITLVEALNHFPPSFGKGG